MIWIGPRVTQTFQIRWSWGDVDGADRPIHHAWANGSEGITRNGSVRDDYPTGTWALAWFCDASIDVRPYIKSDTDPNDENIYVEIGITINKSKVWSCNMITPATAPFIDISGIVWDPSKKDTYTQVYSPLYGDVSGSENQLFGWSGGTTLAGVSGNNQSRGARTWPGGSWSTSHNGTNTPVSRRTFTVTFTEDDFDESGSLKPSKRKMPFYSVSRWHPGYDSQGRDEVDLSSYSILNFNLSGIEFKYVPWAIAKTNWKTCDRIEGDRNKDGLTVRKSGAYNNHIIMNDMFSKVIGNRIPDDADGFRIVKNKWAVSPITPEG